MKLRTRLLCTGLGVAVPTVVVLYGVDARFRHQAASQLLAESARQQMRAPQERQRCEESAATWGGVPLRPGRTSAPPPGRAPGTRPSPPPPPGSAPPVGPASRSGPRPGAPPRLFAYSLKLRALNPEAPKLDASVSIPAEDSDMSVLASPWLSEEVDVLLRMPWSDGPCALILAHGTTSAGWIGAILPARPLWLMPTVLMFIALMIAAGPAVRRIRRLAIVVQNSGVASFDDSQVLTGNDEVAVLSRALAAAAREVRSQLAENRRREQALREFIANTTHDVMTPLTVLADQLTVLEESADKLPKDHTEQMVLRAAMHEVSYIGSILENLAVAAKLGSGAPEGIMTPIDLGALVARVVSRHRSFADKRGVALELGVPDRAVTIEADMTMFEQALSNVVHNAIRHNDAGGHVAVLVEIPAQGGFLVRTVDDGPGIPDTMIARLLQRGTRTNAARTRAPSGQGLGLAITVQVMALHDFKLELGPSAWGGLRVDLSGPLASLA